MTVSHNPCTVTDALAAVRDAVDQCSSVLAGSGRQQVVDLLDTASMTSELTAKILYLVAPLADETEPGTDEALERAADLAVDSRRHIVTGLSLMAGAHAIAAKVVSLRNAVALPAQARATFPSAESRWWPGWAVIRLRAVRLWEVWTLHDLRQVP
ncbi:hypothetical protein [Catellatospora citrea]|nr:hypothetical protein [Catellatospora citrea]RKE07948.1 hypothetical protein C8E86_2788 [Catellatospora citrea]